jgi:hypothetical protein
MTLDEWKVKYEQKAEPLIPLPGFSLYFEPDKGFFYWHKFGDVFEIDHTCTDDVMWAHNKCMDMAVATCCKILRTATYRNWVAYKRLTKATVNWSLSGFRPNGKFYYIFEKQVKG